MPTAYRIRIIFTALAVGVALYCVGAILDRFEGVADSGVALVAKACAVAGPIPVIVWQGMAASGRWRWLTGAAATAAVFGLGRWLQGLFGLDPPYLCFYLGMILQIEAMAMAVAVAVHLVASSALVAVGNRRR